MHRQLNFVWFQVYKDLETRTAIHTTKIFPLPHTRNTSRVSTSRHPEIGVEEETKYLRVRLHSQIGFDSLVIASMHTSFIASQRMLATGVSHSAGGCEVDVNLNLADSLELLELCVSIYWIFAVWSTNYELI